MTDDDTALARYVLMIVIAGTLLGLRDIATDVRRMLRTHLNTPQES